MAGKLTIRRVGHILPTLCLVGILLLAGILTWLCTVGLPDCALRYIEQEAARAGVQLRIGHIKLSPSAGLAIKAQGVELEIAQPDAPSVSAQVRKVLVAFSLSRLLNGDFAPVNAHIKDAQVTLPYGAAPEDTLQLSNLSTYARFAGNGKGISADAGAMLETVELKLRLAIADTGAALASLSSPDSAEEKTTEETLAEIRPWLREIKQQIAAQNWTAEQTARLSLNAAHRLEWRLTANAQVPRYHWQQHQFRDIALNADLERDTLTVNALKFRTVNPDTTVALQLAYDLQDRELEFNTTSTAPLVRLIRDYTQGDPTGLLEKIQSDEANTPTIELSGHAGFAENYALNNITLRGKIAHREVRLGSTPVNSLLLTFFLKNGSFNLDNFRLELPSGYVHATAQATEEKGQAELNFSLPAETLLNLARDFGNAESLSLPEGLELAENLELHLKGEVSMLPFQSGKTQLQDLIPSLRNCRIQLNTGAVAYQDTQISQPAITLQVGGIDYAGDTIKAESLALDAMLGDAADEPRHTAADEVLLNLKLQDLQLDKATRALSIGKIHFRTSAAAASYDDTQLENLHATSEFADLSLQWDDALASLRSAAISGKISAERFRMGETQAEGIHLNVAIPGGLNFADGWRNMQQGTLLEAGISQITGTGNFTATGTTLRLQNTGDYQASLQFASKLGEQELSGRATAALATDSALLLNDLELSLPLASLAPLMGGEPLQELRLPPLVDVRASARIDTATGQVQEARYHINLPELIRVCNNVHVHKGMEIPLALEVDGTFNTHADGSMQYKADVCARHQLGELRIEVSGDPLRKCRITGTNTIPVNIVNALIDNADAHWIMRDFRCRAGITRNVMRHIDTTIRYDKGIYVHALCDAELYNMEFMLGAIRDKEDAAGNPTGEEYLRKDLSTNPYTMVKEGKCGVEVLVQMDCVDEQGNPLPERLRINLNNPDLLYDNKPWFKRMGLKGGPATSRITGEAVRFNIENNTISLHKLKGNCYPAYSIGMYYAPIQHYMEDIILRDPVDIETEYCIFPLSSNCDVPMQGLIHALAPTGAGFRFLGTTIPFENFSGFINISDVDVYLDRMNARSWGGVVNGALRIGFSGKHTSLDGFFAASNLNLRDIVASYGEEFTSATCNGYIRFQAEKPELEDVRAYGEVHLQDGNLMQIGLFRPVGVLLSDMPGTLAKLQQSANIKAEDAQPNWVDKLIRLVFDSGSSAIDSVQNSTYAIPFANHFLRYGIDEAFSRFDITHGHLITRGMKAKGYNLNVGVQLDIDLNTLTLQGDLWPKISSVPTVLLSPVTILSDFLIDINLYGDLLSPQWEFGLSKKLKGDEPSLQAEPAASGKE